MISHRNVSAAKHPLHVSEKHFEAGLAGQVAKNFSTEASLIDWKRIRENKVGIVFGLRIQMMLEMVGTVRERIGHDRISEEPLADEIIELGIFEEEFVRAVVHEDGEAELAGADDRERKDEGDRIGPADERRDGEGDHAPGMKDAQD